MRVSKSGSRGSKEGNAGVKEGYTHGEAKPLERSYLQKLSNHQAGRNEPAKALIPAWGQANDYLKCSTIHSVAVRVHDVGS